MEKLVIPNIENKHSRQRTIDELPQSGEGKTIMTTQPRFVPNEGVKVSLDGLLEFKVRMVDCVGYMVSGAMGFEENKKPRLVKTPWSDEDMPFEEAAELGTKKVINTHSTIGIVMTTDGTICELPRESYVEAEERVVNEMLKENKPFVVIVNSREPNSENCQNLVKDLQRKYKVSVLAVSAKDLQIQDIDNIFEKVLLEFPIKSLKVKMPDWLKALPYDDEIIKNIR